MSQAPPGQAGTRPPLPVHTAAAMGDASMIAATAAAGMARPAATAAAEMAMCAQRAKLDLADVGTRHARASTRLMGRGGGGCMIHLCAFFLPAVMMLLEPGRRGDRILTFVFWGYFTFFFSPFFFSSSIQRPTVRARHGSRVAGVQRRCARSPARSDGAHVAEFWPGSAECRIGRRPAARNAGACLRGWSAVGFFPLEPDISN
jgi:hypothetical protein